jgi:outer membrane protein OmpA-like peptidoglycan-associated protein
LMATAACGATIPFADETAIGIMGTPPPEPPPPPPPEPVVPKRVELRDNKIVFTEKIQFAYNDSKILEASFSLLDEIAKVIKENPHVKKIAIEGHASSEGSDKHNLSLSDRRAKSVMEYLVTKAAIPAEALTATGFGEQKLLANEDGLEGDALDAAREKNRRVEFNVVEQEVTSKKVEVDPKTGTEKIVETNTAKVNTGAAPTEEEPK